MNQNVNRRSGSQFAGRNTPPHPDSPMGGGGPGRFKNPQPKKSNGAEDRSQPNANVPSEKNKSASLRLPPETTQAASASDSKRSAHDELIRLTVDDQNRKFAHTPGFKPLNWWWVRAMIEVEARSGPGTFPWENNPMQIGKKGDPGLGVLQRGEEHSEFMVSKEFRQELQGIGKDKNMDGPTSIKAGVAYLFLRAAKFGYVNVTDGRERLSHTIQKGDTLEKVAKTVGTTVETLIKENKFSEKSAANLRIGQTVYYRKAHKEWQIVGWGDWLEAIKDYNGKGDPEYLEKVKTEYGKLYK